MAETRATEGKGTIIITGSSGNLGSAVTTTLLNKKYRVIATVAAPEGKDDADENPLLDIQAVDLSDESATNAFIKNAIEKYKRVDAALLLVGGFAMGDISTTGITDIRKQISLNFDTAYHVVRPLFQHMMQNNNGRIVLVGSRPALVADAGKDLLAYSLSKSLLFKLAEYLNAAAAGTNVSITVVVPSIIDTPLNRKNMPKSDPEKWVKPEALADVLEFIVSEKAAVLRETVLKVYNNA